MSGTDHERLEGSIENCMALDHRKDVGRHLPPVKLA